MIRSIAERANVSTATVSRILNGKAGHSQATVKSVERAMEELGMSPGAVSNGCMPAIGLVMLIYRDFLRTAYATNLLSGIMERLFAEGFLVQIIPVSENRLSEQYIRQIVATYNLKGLIIQEFEQLYSISQRLSRLDIPVICIAETEASGIRYSVRSDSFQAGYEAGAYLWSLGHRRFLVQTMSMRNICQRLRLEGFQAAIAACGGAPENITVRELRNLTDSVTSIVVELLNAKPEVRPSGLMVSSCSAMAVRLQNELLQAGFRIPGDLSLLSIEEGDELEHLTVPVTVMAQPTREIGELAVSQMINLIRGRQIEPHPVLFCNLLVRQSTAAPPGPECAADNTNQTN